jgi:hypothetical protein
MNSNLRPAEMNADVRLRHRSVSSGAVCFVELPRHQQVNRPFLGLSSAHRHEHGQWQRPVASFLPVISAIEMISMAGISGAGECSIYVAASLADQLFTFLLGNGDQLADHPGCSPGIDKVENFAAANVERTGRRKSGHQLFKMAAVQNF